jgi:hypothetical protein
MKVKGIDIGVKSNEVVPKMPEVEFREKVDYILGESR